MKNTDQPKIVTIGGGTGSFNILQGLKNLTDDISAIISMVDDGGSTGVLRDELGVLPPGDIRQALVALSRSTKDMRELFNYRFSEGTFDGHSFGNLFLSTLEKVTGDFGSGVKTASKVLNIKGRVIPVTLESSFLVVKYEDGEEIVGEHLIDELPFKDNQRPEVFLRPECTINDEAKEAILDADIIVIAPGTLHGSLIPNLVVGGMKDALQQTNAKVVYICNLVTNNGQTSDYQVSDFVSEIERFGGNGLIDFVLYNNKQPSQKLLDKYAKENEFGVKFDVDKLASQNYRAIGDDFVSEPTSADAKGKLYIRHNAKKVTEWVKKIYLEQV